ncbi:hypothetical protein FRC00_001622 [Tulasnella sp. 408]|nr:hypothetical protein FRC00_001622 [Tulasnella sp. 408]
MDQNGTHMPSPLTTGQLELTSVPSEWILDPTNNREDLISALANADWDRIREYSLRVRSVGLRHKTKVDLLMDLVQLFQEFHGPSPLLPNTRAISWQFIQGRNCMSIVPFIGPQLEKLTLTMNKGIDDLDQSLLIQSLAHRVPALTYLRLTSFSLSHHISTCIAALISSLPKLTCLELPPFFLTQEIVAAAAQLRLLTRLSSSETTKATETYHEPGMCFEFMPESFPQLQTLAFASFPNRMAQILQSTEHTSLPTILHKK